MNAIPASDESPSAEAAAGRLSIVVVSGLPRSGTSMLMKMLAEGGMGVVADGARTADEDNPQGYFEDERVKVLHREEDKAWLREAEGKAIKIISFLLPSLPAAHRYQVVFLRRSLDEIIASQNRMLLRRGESPNGDPAHVRGLFTRHLRRIEQHLQGSPGFEVCYVDYCAVVEEPRREAVRINDFLGHRLDPDRMARAVNGRLYRNRFSQLQAATGSSTASSF